MACAPVVMFVYNRADHFEKTVNALASCAQAELSDLYIFSDAAKNEAAEDSVRLVRDLAHKTEQENRFKTVTVIEREKNMGLAASVISGVTDIIARYGRVIVLEDDCVPSPYLLSYMNSCLDYYEDDQSIGSISGFTPPMELPADYDKDIFLAYRSCSWGWATWKDRWEDVEWDSNSLKELCRDPEILKRLNANGTDRFIRLYRQLRVGGHSWSIRFGYHLAKKGMLTVYPRCSYICNIGLDGSGVNSKAEDEQKMTVSLSGAIAEPVIEKPELDNRIQKRMKKAFSGGLVSDIKRALATRAIIIKEKRKYE